MHNNRLLIELLTLFRQQLSSDKFKSTSNAKSHKLIENHIQQIQCAIVVLIKKNERNTHTSKTLPRELILVIGKTKREIRFIFMILLNFLL